MKLEFMWDDAKVFEREEDFIPPPGSTIVFPMHIDMEDFPISTQTTAVVRNDLPRIKYGMGETVVTLKVSELASVTDAGE